MQLLRNGNHILHLDLDDEKITHAERVKALTDTLTWDYRPEKHCLTVFGKIAPGTMMVLVPWSLLGIVSTWILTGCILIGLFLVTSGVRLAIGYERARDLRGNPKIYTHLPSSKAYSLLIWWLVELMRPDEEERSRSSREYEERLRNEAKAVFDRCFDSPQGREWIGAYFRNVQGQRCPDEAEKTALTILLES